jgi:hypothetical protein
MPARQITDPMLQILWSLRRLFLWVMCLTFVILATITFTLTNQLATVRSSIEVGSSTVNQKQEPFDPPDQVARQVSSVYVPTALSELEKKGASPSVLHSLRTTTVESVARSLVLVSTIDARAENEAKEFHQSIADQIINAQSRRAQLIRDVITERIATARRRSISLSEQSDTAAREIDSINVLSKDLRGQIERERASLADLVDSKDDERASRLQGQISSKMISLASLTIERAKLIQSLMTLRQQSDAQAGVLVQAQFDEKTLGEPRVSLPPLLISMKDTPRRLSLLFIAFTISILIAFGTVVFVHRVTEARN